MSEFQQVVKEGANNVGRRILRIFLALCLLAIVAGGIYVWASGWTYSEGTRAGYLIKVSSKGVVFKTYEGQLNLGGFQMDDVSGVSGNIWNFSTTSSEVYEDLQRLEGQKVELSYRQRYRSFAWQGDTDYFVYSVEAVSQPD